MPPRFPKKAIDRVTKIMGPRFRPKETLETLRKQAPKSIPLPSKRQTPKAVLPPPRDMITPSGRKLKIR